MADWRECRLGDLGVVVGGGTPPRERTEFWNGSIPWLTPGELTGHSDKYVSETQDCLSELGLAASGARLLSEGSLLITSRASIGSCALAGRPMATNQGFKNLAPGSEVDPSFLFYLGRTLGKEMTRRASGTTFLEISGREFEHIKIHLPPFEEQRRIAEILDTIDETIRTSRRVIEKLREVENGLLLNVLDTYFPGRGPLSLRASRSADECVVLSALLESREIELGRGKVISSIDIADDPGPHPIYSSSASATGEFGTYGKFMFDEELITWSVDGGGRPFYRPQHRFSVTNVGGFLRIRASQHWSYRFVHALMEVQHAQLTFDWLTKAHPSVIRDLYWFPRIPLSEQHQITKRLAAADVSVQQQKAEMVKLSRLRSGLAADLLSGCVRTVAA